MIDVILQKTNNTSFGGSKSRKQVRGRRVLKNGAVGGYVKQSNGTWKWIFLAKSRN